MAFENTSPNTGTALAAMAPDAVRKLWKQGVDVFEQSNDFFAPMEGGADSLIHTITDTEKGKGQKIEFTVMSGFYDEPHMGEELFEDADDYEEILIDSHDLEVDWMRWGTRVTERMEEVMGMRNEIMSGLNTQIGAWLGRQKTEKLFMMFREKIDAENIVYANGKSQDTLVAADVLDWDEILSLGVQMGRLGGLPAKVGRANNGNPINRNAVIATTDALYSLDLDPNYKQVLRETRVESNAKMIFDGGYTDVKGHFIREYTPIDHDGEGAIGSPLNAKAKLGVAIAAGTTTFDITGGGNPTSAAKAKKLYFKYFPGYAYRFLPSDVLSPGSTTRYCLIVNPPNAAVDPNKIGMYQYTTGNNGNKITITKRLGSAASGDRITTMGDVVWNTGVWLNKHTDVHPVGATIYPCNAKGQVFGDTLMLGRRAARRGYGMYRNHRSSDEKEGGFIKEKYVTSVFGQGPRRDRLGRVPGVFRLRHALNIAGSPLPIII